MNLAKTAVILGLASCPMFANDPAGVYEKPLEKGSVMFSTVGGVVQFFTGNAVNWRSDKVQVRDSRTGQLIKKSALRYRHLHPGDMVVINKDLVPTVTYLTQGRSLKEVCDQAATKMCLSRLISINDIQNAFGPLPPTIQVPVWFQIKPMPAPPPPPEPKKQTPPQPTPTPINLWVVILTVAAFLVVITFILAWLNRHRLLGWWRPCRPWVLPLSRHLKAQLSQAGVQYYRIIPALNSIIIQCNNIPDRNIIKSYAEVTITKECPSLRVEESSCPIQQIEILE